MDRALIVSTLLLNLAVLLPSLHPQEKALSHPSRYRLVHLAPTAAQTASCLALHSPSTPQEL